jgi:catechol 2,3-dioxygenase-like lactoylglutathione lyase family enzyme
MIHHLDLAVTDLARSRAFYERALAPQALRLVIVHPTRQGREALGFGRLPDPVFWIRDGRPVIGPLHLAFDAPSRDAVDEFHRAALEAGGTCNGKPGLRPRYADNWYAAYVLDPDGNNIEAVCRREA